jgi:hypothetical protein
MNEGRKRETTPEKAADKPSRSGMSRREFARRAALASAVASLVPVQAATATEPARNDAPAAGSSAQTPPAQSSAAPQTPAANLPKLSPESQAEVDARVQAILAQYGSRLSDDQQADIRRLCTLAQPPLDRMRAYHLDNADGSALYLKPLVEREKKPAAPKPAAAAAKTPSAAPVPTSKPSTPATKKNP